MFTKDLLKRQDKVFTNKKRDYGPLSILIAVATVIILVPVYAAYVGAASSITWVMVLGGLLLAVALPWFLARKLRSRGPRLFALVNVLAGILLFTLLGKQTDAVLETYGNRPFLSLAKLLGSEEPEAHWTAGAGRGFVGVLRAMTVGGAEQVEDEGEDGTDEDPPAVAEEPRADAALEEVDVEHHEGISGDPVEEAIADEVEDVPGIQAHVEALPDESRSDAVVRGSKHASGGQMSGRPAGSLPAGHGTYTIFSGSPKSSTVEVPIEREGRTFTVGVLIDGRVPADFVFDTGADVTAITPALARRLGIDPEKLSDIRTFHTAGGVVQDPVVRLGRLAIDHAEVRDIEVVVCRRCSNNLLGRNFHGGFRVEIDGTEGVLRMHSR